MSRGIVNSAACCSACTKELQNRLSRGLPPLAMINLPVGKSILDFIWIESAITKNHWQDPSSVDFFHIVKILTGTSRWECHTNCSDGVPSNSAKGQEDIEGSNIQSIQCTVRRRRFRRCHYCISCIDNLCRHNLIINMHCLKHFLHCGAGNRSCLDRPFL